MKKSSRPVKNKEHMRSMLAVLNRYNIGSRDSLGRGWRWIVESELPHIKAAMLADPTLIQRGEEIFVMGTNQHDWVEFHDFVKLFNT